MYFNFNFLKLLINCIGIYIVSYHVDSNAEKNSGLHQRLWYLPIYRLQGCFRNDHKYYQARNYNNTVLLYIQSSKEIFFDDFTAAESAVTVVVRREVVSARCDDGHLRSRVHAATRSSHACVPRARVQVQTARTFSVAICSRGRPESERANYSVSLW